MTYTLTDEERQERLTAEHRRLRLQQQAPRGYPHSRYTHEENRPASKGIPVRRGEEQPLLSEQPILAEEDVGTTSGTPGNYRGNALR